MFLTHSLPHKCNVRDCDITVKRINETEKKGQRIGDVSFLSCSIMVIFKQSLKTVLYVPDLGFDLFSPNAVFDGKTWERL